jgi:hypothetical protein
LGEPLFIENFDIPSIVFFILADGTEGELSMERARDFIAPYGHWRPLLDKAGILAEVRPRSQPAPEEQLETLRQQITWFWHDLSHFITAIARGQLWWAAGQLEILRRICVNLARLRHNMVDEEVGDDPNFKLDKALPAGALAPLRPTFVPLERAALFDAAQTIIGYFREAAIPLAAEHGLRYPAELERLMLERLERARDS